MLMIRLAAEGDLFVGRPAGQRLRRRLERQVSESESDVVGLDFRGVKAFDHSAADEAIAKLLISLRSGLIPPRRVVFVNATEAQAEHVGWVLERRNLVGITGGRGGTRLIGKVPHGVAAVFAYAAAHHAVRAVDLGRALRISTNAASNRLRLLWAAGVFTRSEVSSSLGGRAFSYRLASEFLPEDPRGPVAHQGPIGAEEGRAARGAVR